MIFNRGDFVTIYGRQKQNSKTELQPQYDKLNDKSKSLADRIDSVNKYCNVEIKQKDKFLGITDNWRGF